MNVEIIAEIGCNHGGSLGVAMSMATQARDAGCTYAKFQHYDPAEIRFAEGTGPGSLYTEKLYTTIERTRLSLDDLRALKRHCDIIGLEFLCTPFLNPEKVRELDPLVKRWKIRERDSRNIPLIRAALDTGKEVLISSTVARPLDPWLLYHPRVQWLFCIPRYPAALEDLSLDALQTFHGYSNHIPSITAPLASTVVAKVAGFVDRWILEVHVKTSHAQVPKAVDSAVSLSFTQVERLRKMVDEVARCG